MLNWFAKKNTSKQGNAQHKPIGNAWDVIERQRQQEEKFHQKNQAHIAQMEQYKQAYQKARFEFGYRKKHNETVSWNNKNFFAFVIENAELRLFECPPANWNISANACLNWQTKKIQLDDIYFFAKEGDVTTNVTASGGGSDIGRAIIGGILAGNAGAIIASRKETKVETTTTDTRKTVLYYKGGQLTFAPGDYTALMKLIPDKEISAVQRIVAQKAAQQPTTNTATERLRSLKEMLDADLITAEEYEAKKAKILEDL